MTDLTLGIETKGGVMTPIIRRGTVIPAKKKHTLSTIEDQQTSVTIAVFEGERSMVKDNHQLGKYDLNISPAARGVHQIEIIFEIDENSILTVNVIDKNFGMNQAIPITNDEGRLTYDNIMRMLDEAEKFADEDKATKERIDAKHSLQNYMDILQNTIDYKDKLAEELD